MKGVQAGLTSTRATLCKQKEDGWFQRNGDYTVEQLEAEIDRLNRLLMSYNVMAKAMGFTINNDLSVGAVDLANIHYPIDQPGDEPDVKAKERKLEDAYRDVYEKSAKLAAETRRLAGKSLAEKEADGLWKAASDALNTSRSAFRSANDAHQKAQSDYTKWAVASMKDSTSAGMGNIKADTHTDDHSNSRKSDCHQLLAYQHDATHERQHCQA